MVEDDRLGGGIKGEEGGVYIEIEPVTVMLRPNVARLCKNVGSGRETWRIFHQKMQATRAILEHFHREKTGLGRRGYTLSSRIQEGRKRIARAFRDLTSADLVLSTRMEQLRCAVQRRQALIQNYRREVSIVISCPVPLLGHSLNRCNPTLLCRLALEDVRVFTCGVQAAAIREHVTSKKLQTLITRSIRDTRALNKVCIRYKIVDKKIKTEHADLNAYEFVLDQLE